MRKVLSLILVITMLLTLTASVSGCGSDTDYDSPIKVIAAYKNGRDVIGKTVSVHIYKLSTVTTPSTYFLVAVDFTFSNQGID